MHHLEAGDQVGDLLGFAPRTFGDARGATLVDDVGFAPFLGGHGLDQRLEDDKGFVVDTTLGHATFAKDRELLVDLRDRANLLQHLQLLHEVFEGEFAAQELLGVPLGLFLVDDVLEVFHQTDDIAHSEDTGGETLGSERLELVEGFADAEELDRLAGDLLDR